MITPEKRDATCSERSERAPTSRHVSRPVCRVSQDPRGGRVQLVLGRGVAEESAHKLVRALGWPAAGVPDQRRRHTSHSSGALPLFASLSARTARTNMRIYGFDQTKMVSEYQYQWYLITPYIGYIYREFLRLSSAMAQGFISILCAWERRNSSRGPEPLVLGWSKPAASSLSGQTACVRCDTHATLFQPWTACRTSHRAWAPTRLACLLAHAGAGARRCAHISGHTGAAGEGWAQCTRASPGDAQRKP